MTLNQVSSLLEKIKRIQINLGSLDGDGFEWALTHEDLGYQEYSIKGIKEPKELQDEIENGFIWLWSLKDYVKKYSLAQGKDKKWVDNQVNNTECLCLCADIANSLKHGGIDRDSRSGKKPTLSEVAYKIPQEGINKLTLYADRVETVVSDTSTVKVSMDINDLKSGKLGDAFELINKCLIEWKKIIEKATA
ncbi:hypothetical protein ACU6TU_06405 [Halomonas sp. LS-001]